MHAVLTYIATIVNVHKLAFPPVLAVILGDKFRGMEDDIPIALKA